MLKSSRAFTIIAIIALASVAAEEAEAGIVNVQSALATEAKEGASGSITASADWRTGNSRLLLLGISPVARYRAGKHLFITILRGDYGKSGDNEIVKKAFEHVRYRYDFHPRILGELFQQTTYDKFRLLRMRALVGAGPKFDLVARKQISLSLGIAYMLEYEQPNSQAVEHGDRVAGRLAQRVPRIGQHGQEVGRSVAVAGGLEVGDHRHPLAGVIQVEQHDRGPRPGRC